MYRKHCLLSDVQVSEKQSQSQRRDQKDLRRVFCLVDSTKYLGLGVGLGNRYSADSFRAVVNCTLH